MRLAKNSGHMDYSSQITSFYCVASNFKTEKNACTHYGKLYDKILEFFFSFFNLWFQGSLVNHLTLRSLPHFSYTLG